MNKLKHKIEEKRATIGILGLGHTGLFLANEFRAKGFPIIGYDIDDKKIQKLKNKENYLPFFVPQALFSGLEEQLFTPTNDPALLQRADCIIISVPTPLDKHHQPDLLPLISAAQTISKVLHNQLIVVQSTSFPGTTKEVVLPILATSGKKVGEDFFLAHVPEREDAGNANLVLSTVPRLVGGITGRCTQMAQALYESITDKVIPTSSASLAEATKVFENTYRLINIAFVDEMKIAFDRMGLDIWEIIDAASSKPFGFTAFYPGPGIGGECIPVDPLYLAWKGKEYDAPTEMIEVASRINYQATRYVADTIYRCFNERFKCINGSKILILGAAFKKDVTDIRESPTLRLIPLLRSRGAHVAYSDPLVPHLAAFNMDSIPLDEETLASFDCVVIITDHSLFDFPWICKHSELIVDTRNATKNLAEFKHKIVK